MFSLYLLYGFRKFELVMRDMQKNFKRDAQNVDITDRAQILHTYLGPEMGSKKL